MSYSSYSPVWIFTVLFASALVLQLGIELWLASRQARHVMQHRGVVPPAFAHRMTLFAHQRAADYTVDCVRLGMLENVFSALVLISWTLLGGLDALNQALLGWTGPGFIQQLAVLLVFAVVSALLGLPWSLFKTFVIEQRYGFNKMTARLWLADAVKSMLVAALLGIPLAAAVLWLMQMAGSLWWLWAWALWVGFNVLLMWLFPTVIAPLFNRFKPLDDIQLKERIEALMARSGFQAQGLFVMDGSKRSAHANAYFTGLGNAKRVVFFDTLLNKLNPAELEAVLAHELGHFKYKHITKRLWSFFALSFVGFAALGWLLHQAWFYWGLGVMPAMAVNKADIELAVGNNSALALILFSMVISVFGGLFQPILSQLSRKHEFEADAYAVAQTNSQDLANALLKLYEDNASTLTPDPLYARFHYSHPPATERLARMQAHG
ncbi:M48 family metallopeptidase [Lampropedia aestuarii]|uniref:M48 family metallopeptidase n=1 Tax=Lampropedia aestuarii TaxID=2562762 RepID=UPI0024690BF9|nr:M48 family metallopeptidase [Lampropedia aestuarii]MDH5856749.1 M48 family metallopeptidase [Lampropedia aestuarii]